MREAKHELHAGLVSALQMLWDRVKERQAAGLRFPNEVHIRRELNLSRDAWTNFSKLKWLNLACQWRKNSQKMPRGFWGMTQTGIDFLEGRRKIQPIVYTFNRKQTRRTGNLVGVEDFIRKEATFEIDAPVEAREAKQATLTA